MLRLSLFVSVLVCGITLNAQVPELAPHDAPASGEVAPPAEPGRRLLITGRVIDDSTRNAVPGASLYIYQTDTTGHYTSDGTNDNRNPRLRLHLRSGPSGEFEARTIRPAPYPRGGAPAHIHFVVEAPGYERRAFEIVFDDDPLVTQEIRARAQLPESMFTIVTTPATGPARVEYDIRVRRTDPGTP